MKTTILNIQPKATIYSTFSRNHYKVKEALAEFIDNSTGSYFQNIERLRKDIGYKLKIDIIYYKGEIKGSKNTGFLIIRDNAYGMERDDFNRAILLDSPPNYRGGRSEFGMGLKTASFWFGKKLEIETKRLDSTNRFSTTIDMEEMEKNNDDSICINTEENAEKSLKGTEIKISNLLQPISPRCSKTLKTELANIYRRDIQQDNIRIRYIEKYNFGVNFFRFNDGDPKKIYEKIDDIPCIKFEPPKIYEEINESGELTIFKKPFQEYITFDLDGKKYEISGFIAIREFWSKSNAGFALFRRNRIIEGGLENNYRPKEIFGQSGLDVHSMLFGEINLDDWPVSQAKNSFAWENGLEEKFIEKMQEISEEYILKIKNITKTKKIESKKIKDSEVEKYNKELFKKAKKRNDSDKTKVKMDIQKPFIQDDKLAINAILYSDLNPEEKCVVQIRSSSEMVSKDQEWIKMQDISEKSSEENSKIYCITMFLNHHFFRPYSNKPKFLFLIRYFILSLSCSIVQSIEFLDCLEDSENTKYITIIENLNKYLQDETYKELVPYESDENDKDDEETY